ncbi:MAG: 2-hydroxyacid dehydrogenase [Flavobacteriaceae bacterium]
MFQKPIGLLTPQPIGERWIKAFEKEAPEVTVLLNKALREPSEIELLLVWKHPKGSLQNFKNLQLLYSLGAGVDHLMSDPDIPKDVPICRIVDPLLAFSMSNYIVYAVLDFQRRMDKYRQDQHQKIWDHYAAPERNIRIGVLGLGTLGQDAALKLRGLGFDVAGYSPSPKNIPGIACHHSDQLPAFLQSVNVLVCTVPYTSDTHALLNTSLFQQLPKGSYLINVARGKVQVENDILEALETHHLSGAFLDVFETEPLPKDSPLWHHPKVTITPHIASITKPEAGVRQIVANWERVQNKTPLEHQVDLQKGY